MRKHFWFIETAPKNATNIEVQMHDGKRMIAHFAKDLSGEDCPPFVGWFTKSKNGNYYNQIKKPDLWRPIA